jgi:solute:Na+ symporter, SSS family
MIRFQFGDYVVFIVYFALVLFFGFRSRTNSNDEADYLVAGRRITLPAFVATLVSTFYGGILGIGEFTYNYGLSSWFLNAFPYYLFITIFAIFFAEKIRNAGLYTIPEKLKNVFGGKVSFFSAVLIFLLVNPAPYILMLGVLIQVIFNFSFYLSLIFGLIISIVFLFKGGLRADISANIVEFIFMFLGFGIIIPFCFLKLGGFEFISSNLPSRMLNITGGNSLQFIIVWFVIGSWALIEPSFHQRCYAAKTPKVARNGVYVSLIFWFIFDFMTTTAGLYAAASIKNLGDPKMSYPLLAESILPVVAKGVFFVGMIATIMSTLHSYLFISATTLGRDILSKLTNKTDSTNQFSKISILITSAVSLTISILVPSVVQIWYIIGSLVIPSMLLGVIPSYFKKIRITKLATLSAMLVSFIVCLFCFIYGYLNKEGGSPKYLFNIEPMYPGLALGVIYYLINLLRKRSEVI